MADNQEPEWKDISFLPLIGNLIDQGVKDIEDSYRTFLEAKSKPHVLDDRTIERALKIYGDRKTDHWFFEEQIARWKKLPLPNETLNELDRLEEQLEIDLVLLNKIIFLAGELKKGTIDTILAKDDLDLAFEVLEGKRAVPADLNPPEGYEISKESPGKPPMIFSAEQLQIASMIDQKIKSILKADGDMVAILKEMHIYMPGFKRIMDTTTPEEFNELGRQHFGFFHFAQILEDLASGIRSGEIPVPE